MLLKAAVKMSVGMRPYTYLSNGVLKLCSVAKKVQYFKCLLGLQYVPELDKNFKLGSQLLSTALSFFVHHNPPLMWEYLINACSGQAPLPLSSPFYATYYVAAR